MARLVDGYSELVWTWDYVHCVEGCLYARYEVGLLWHGAPVLNPAITWPWPRPASLRYPRWDASVFYEAPPGFIAGADHDADFLATFREALASEEVRQYEGLEPFVLVQFFPRGIDLNLQKHPIGPGEDWRTFDILVLLTPYQLRHPEGVEREGMGIAGAPAFYVTPSRAAAAAFFFDLLDEYLELVSDEVRREAASELTRLLDGLDRQRRTFVRCD
jgi:hypothetical protein